jgi:DeoR/GlpR family transcriptional regulator of sugar metabolism
MKPTARQARIADKISTDGTATVEALAAVFDVSLETIRRDLGLLARAGLVTKVHGGAARPRLTVEASFQQRMAENAAAKARIAQKLVAAVPPGATLFMDTGSTTLAAAEALAPRGGLRVITNALRIAQVMGAGGSEIYLLGGRFGPDNAQTFGPLALAQIAGFQADFAVLTLSALAPAGAMDADFDEAQIARAMAARAGQRILLADATKFDRHAAFPICELAEIDLLISDQPPQGRLLHALDAAGVRRL